MSSLWKTNLFDIIIHQRLSTFSDGLTYKDDKYRIYQIFDFYHREYLEKSTPI